MRLFPHCLSPLLISTVLLSARESAQATPLTFQSAPRPISLVELYTSEGCSSCPPAEAWMEQWQSNPQLFQTIFPVVFHVDYWNGLSWTDAFAQPKFTQRQQAYAAQLGQDSVYTPEFVVNGREWRSWFHQPDTELPQTPTAGTLQLVTSADRRSWEAHYVPSSGQLAARVQVALLGTGLVSNVGGGENAGRRLVHDFTVLQLSSGSANAVQDTLRDNLPGAPSARRALVAWASDAQGRILQVTGGWLPALQP